MFKKITYDDLAILKKQFESNPNQGCEFSLGNAYMWNHHGSLEYDIIKDSLVFRNIEDDMITYHIQRHSSEFIAIVEQLVSEAKASKKKVKFSNLLEPMIDELKERYPDQFSYSYQRDNCDYIYEVASLRDLSGKKYHGKKNHVNKFKKTYEFQYEEISKDNIEECRNMKDQWAQLKEESNASFQDELTAVNIALDHFEEFGLVGGAIRIDGEVKAFTFGEKLTDDTFVTHVEKAYDDIHGLYSAINQQFAQNSLQEYTYVNREEDLGVEGLRKAKLSYHPAILWEKHEAVYLG
ncbi:hypothetical protein lbkm_3861 [Lachnospiraceae bacterium KM106-2]|nr:hypothetical protein lbkm_3861 [Lachnospiraceae bacterium KM106-2]